MDIKINAQNRYVEVTDVELDLELAAGIVYDLWAATADNKEQSDQVPKLSAGSNSHLDKGYRSFGFARFNEGERAEVK